MAYTPPYNHNKPWSQFDDKCLKHLFLKERTDSDMTYHDIAKEFGRSMNAIRFRLCKLGLIAVKVPTYKHRKRKHVGKWKVRKKE